MKTVLDLRDRIYLNTEIKEKVIEDFSHLNLFHIWITKHQLLHEFKYDYITIFANASIPKTIKYLIMPKGAFY